MIGGQYRDVRPEETLDAGGLERTSRLKTGALLGASRRLRRDRGGRGRRATSPPRARFGVELGLLFQIVDDVLDETGSDEALGKPAGADARRGRRTFASELGLAGARERARRERARGPRAPRRAPRVRARPAGGARQPGRDPRPLSAECSGRGVLDSASQARSRPAAAGRGCSIASTITPSAASRRCRRTRRLRPRRRRSPSPTGSTG